MTGKTDNSEKNLSQCHFVTTNLSILIFIYTVLLPEGQTGEA
jgi:hypothetical protein